MKTNAKFLVKKIKYKILGYVVSVIVLIFLLTPLRFPSPYEYIEDEWIAEEFVPVPDKTEGNLCPVLPKFDTELVLHPSYVKSYNEIQFAKTYDIKKGGSWSPTQCVPRYTTALVIPYRGRPEQLQTFLHYIHPFLQRQLIEYRVFVVEQTFSKPFNRGKLMNIGFHQAMQLSPSPAFHCFIFHDVDLLPQNLMNLYACTKKPRHMASSINIWRYNLLYGGAFGGVVAFQQQHFKTINGFSNIYFGWGGEDDDMRIRTVNSNLTYCRFSPQVSRYYMLKHKQEEKNPIRNEILNTASQRLTNDGLNTLQYRVMMYENTSLYTHLVVDL